MKLRNNIFTYHNIADENAISYTSISKKLFKKHLNSLIDKDIQSFIKQDVYNGLFLKQKSKVLITFDDGYEDVYYNALPLMREFGFTGIVFIPALFIGKLNIWDFSPLGYLRHLSRDMLISLSKNGWIIGSHSMSHPDLRKAEKKVLLWEICESKKLLEDILGEEIFLFAYPFGLYDKRVVETVRYCGYKFAFATSKGMSNNIFAIERMSLYFIDKNPVKLATKWFPFYRRRNRIISSLSSLTPIYKRLPVIGKIQGHNR